MPEYQLDHLHLNNVDSVKAAELYQKAFGAEKVSTKEMPDGRTLVELNLNGTSIKITSPRVNPLAPDFTTCDSGMEHFGLRTDDLEAAVEELRAQGIRIVQEIKLGLSARIAFCLTPDGVLIELMEKKQG